MSVSESGSGALPYKGLTSAEVEARRREFGANVLTPPERDPWWKLFLEKFDDPVIRILIIAAVIAIVSGAANHWPNWWEGLTEGVGIIVAILLATTLAFVNEFKAAKEFDVLNQVNDQVAIKVIRDGGFLTVPRTELVVDDIVHIEVGEETPADGSVLEAVSLQVDESRLTGESVPAAKAPAGSAKAHTGETAYSADRVLRGTMVVDGYGFLRLTAVGDNTEIGKTARAAAEVTEGDTPLNQQLEGLSKVIGVVGLGVAAGTYLALVLRGVFLVAPGSADSLALSSGEWYFVGALHLAVMAALVRVWLPIAYDGLGMVGLELEPPAWLENEGLVGWLVTIVIGLIIFGAAVAIGIPSGLMTSNWRNWIPAHAGGEFLQYFMIAVTLIVVAVPEGLAMSVTLSLAYSMRKMTATNTLVRKMHACETIGAATMICSDKTGTLTLNQMRVSEGVFPSLNGAPLSGASGPSERLIVENISANTSAHLSRKPGEETTPLGNPTEGALLLWLDSLGIDYMHERGQFDILYQWVFTTELKYMATLGKSAVLGANVLHVKGAPEIVLERCVQQRIGNGEVEPLDPAKVAAIHAALKTYQARGMRTLGFAYHEAPRHAEDIKIEEVAHGMTWLGFVAIADPVRPEVPGAIDACRDAGVKVKVVTGDNSETGLEIARQIGLWQTTDTADKHLTGKEFAALSDEDAARVAPGIKVLSRARPMDKMRLVRLLRDGGQVVAVTGDGTNDAPALNHANVGLAMGKTGTAVAKEASDIILLDDSFKSIVNAIMWGRSLYENIQRFILFQLTINVAALCIALMGPFIGIKLPLTVIQMLWVNLIMDTFAALALATEPPHWDVMKRPPRHPEAFIVTKPMAVNIFATAAIFIAILIGLIFVLQGKVPGADFLRPGEHLSGATGQHAKAGEAKEGGDPDDSKKVASEADRPATRGDSIFFAIFVLLQFWNLFNARCMGSSRSAFSGLFENMSFLLIAGAILIGQILLTQFGGAIFRTAPLGWQDWLVILGGTSLVLWIGELLRLIRRFSSPPEPGVGIG